MAAGGPDLSLTMDGSGSCNLHQTDTMGREFLLTVDSSESRDFHRTATMISDRLLTLAIGGTRWNVRSPSYGRCKTSLIVRSGLPNSPDLDRTADGGSARTTIVVRSCPDRSAIGIPKRRNQSHDPTHGFGRRSFEHQHHDRRPIAVRSWRDRGSD